MAIADVLFLPWPSWAKLSFVLGGFLVIVAFVAATVKIMNCRRLLRFERIVEPQVERGDIPIRVNENTEVPFGVKALDGGPSIEGVWNAHTATPLQGPRSRNRSPLIQPAKMLRRSKRDVSVSSIPPLDITEPTSTDDAAVVAPLMPFDGPTEQSPATLPKRGKAKSITISYSRPSARSEHASSYAGLEAEGLLNGPVSPADTTFRSDSPPKLRLHPSSCKTENRRRRFVIGGRTSPTKTPSKPPANDHDVIDRMNAHRRLHSAEQGQLIPRIRPHSEDNARVETDYCQCDEVDGSPSRAVSWPSDEQLRQSNSKAQKLKTITASPAVAQTAKVEARPPAKLCPSAWSEKTQELMHEHIYRHISVDESVVTPSLCSDTTLSTAVAGDEAVSIENKVTRKVNDGFEILPAGSLQKEAEIRVVGIWPDAGQDDTNQKRRPRKLQKKHRRSSSAGSYASRTSSESTRSSRFALMHRPH